VIGPEAAAFLARYLAIPAAILCSAAAQILLKMSSGYAAWSRGWLLFLALSAALYGLSLLLFQHLLRVHPMSRIYPLLTSSVILLITLYGFLRGEHLAPRQLLGIALCVGAIFLLLP
jgi:multidrug transporter EmrE-like cation transporter